MGFLKGGIRLGVRFFIVRNVWVEFYDFAGMGKFCKVYKYMWSFRSESIKLRLRVFINVVWMEFGFKIRVKSEDVDLSMD